jgi:hypothetical protein
MISRSAETMTGTVKPRGKLEASAAGSTNDDSAVDRHQGGGVRISQQKILKAIGYQDTNRAPTPQFHAALIHAAQRRWASYPGTRAYRSGCGTVCRSSPSIPAKSPGLQVKSGMSSAIAAAAIKAS